MFPLKRFFDSVNSRLNHVGSRNKTAQSLDLGRIGVCLTVQKESALPRSFHGFSPLFRRVRNVFLNYLRLYCCALIGYYGRTISLLISHQASLATTQIPVQQQPTIKPPRIMSSRRGGRIRPHERDTGDENIEILGANIAVSAEHTASVKAMERQGHSAIL